MDVETKIAVIKSFAQEIITEQELRELFETNDHPVAYDGFEPSGIAPVHFGLLRARNLKKMLSIGIHFKLYLADYFAFINNKLGGDLERIQNSGRYFVEVWKAAGIDVAKVDIVWANELMKDFSYWDKFIKTGKVASIERIKRAITIMGRKQGEKVSSAQLMYPLMQVTDIFQMGINLCQLGIDQRRANVLARETAKKYDWRVPVAAHHPLMLGLQGIPQGANPNDENALIDYKMSKSQPKTCIYMHETYDQLKKKITDAYCPERSVEGNPIINYLDTLLIEDKTEPILIERAQKFGGNIELSNFTELIESYKSGKIHPADLKTFVVEQFELKIKPVREYFDKHKEAMKLYKMISSYSITR